jgi:ribosome biogenesis protein MAK21
VPVFSQLYRYTTGVNRAHPYLSKKDQALEGHMDTLYRVAHTATPAARTRALLLLFHVTVSTAASGVESVPTDRAPSVQHSADGDEDHREKRRGRFYRALYSTLSDPAMLGGGKHLTMYFNLLYKSIKYDNDSCRALAFVKRVLTTSLHCGAPVSAASIFLVHEITKHHSNVTACLAEALEGPDAIRVLDPTKREPRGAFVVKSGVEGGTGKFETDNSTVPSPHDRAGLWEVALFQHHYHPAVAKFATVVGNDDGLNYRGDPLRDFGLQPFLDKFSYRNPKSSERDQPKRDVTVGQRKGSGAATAGRDTVPLNDPAFLQQPTVDVQDEFFHKFFVERARRDALKGVVRKSAGAKVDEGDGAKLYMDEQGALDEAEDWDGSKRFEDWEEKWETDLEEEAFVDSLTQKIIEDSIGKHGPDELDDEDPDMDGWDDLHDEDEDEDDGNDDDVDDDDHFLGESSDQGEASLNSEGSSEGDAFMEEDASSDNSDDESGGGRLDDEEFLESFDNVLLESENSTNDDNDSGCDDVDGGWGDDDDDDDDVDEDDDDAVVSDGSNEEEDSDHDVKRSTRRKVQKNTSNFAALEDFEDKINESWFSLVRPAPAPEDQERRNESTAPGSKRLSKKKRKK